MVLYGVPQGSVLGSILLYTADVLQLVKSHQLQPHAYADDMQIYGSCRPSDVDALQECVSVCIDEVTSWMMANRLQLNPTKNEVLWCSSSHRQHQIPTGPFRVGNAAVLPLSAVRDLGIYIDADVTMRAHVTATARVCFAALRQIRSVRCSVTHDALLTLLRSLVITKLNFGGSALTGASGSLMQRLQSVLNAASSVLGEEIRTHNSTSP